jgi:hypothetical protein
MDFDLLFEEFEKKKPQYRKRNEELLKRTEGGIRFHYPAALEMDYVVWSGVERCRGRVPTFTRYYKEKLDVEGRRMIDVEWI